MVRLLPLNKDPERVGGTLVGVSTGFGTTAFAFASPPSSGDVLATLTPPFGAGTVYTSISGDTQVSFNTTTGVFTRSASGTWAEGETKVRKVRATSADGKREVTETFRFLRSVAVPLAIFLGGSAALFTAPDGSLQMPLFGV